MRSFIISTILQLIISRIRSGHPEWIAQVKKVLDSQYEPTISNTLLWYLGEPRPEASQSTGEKKQEGVTSSLPKSSGKE